MAAICAASGKRPITIDRKSTRLNSSHVSISYAVFCLKKKKPDQSLRTGRPPMQTARLEQNVITERNCGLTRSLRALRNWEHRAQTWGPAAENYTRAQS